MRSEAKMIALVDEETDFRVTASFSMESKDEESAKEDTLAMLSAVYVGYLKFGASNPLFQNVVFEILGETLSMDELKAVVDKIRNDDEDFDELINQLEDEVNDDDDEDEDDEE